MSEPKKATREDWDQLENYITDRLKDEAEMRNFIAEARKLVAESPYGAVQPERSDPSSAVQQPKASNMRPPGYNTTARLMRRGRSTLNSRSNSTSSTTLLVNISSLSQRYPPDSKNNLIMSTPKKDLN